MIEWVNKFGLVLFLSPSRSRHSLSHRVSTPLLSSSSMFMEAIYIKTISCNPRTKKYQFYCPSLNVLARHGARGLLMHGIVYVVVDKHTPTILLNLKYMQRKTKPPNLTGFGFCCCCFSSSFSSFRCNNYTNTLRKKRDTSSTHSHGV